MGRKSTLTQHHVLPVARGGTSNDITLWADKFHEAFHVIFGDLKPEECIELFRRVSVPGTFWTNSKLHNLRKQIKKEGVGGK